MAKADGMDEGPEPPRTPQGRPLRRAHISQGIGGVLTGQGANDGGVGGIEEDGPDGEISRHLDAGGPPRAAKVQVGFHEGEPVVTQRSVDHETGGSASEGTGEVDGAQRLALVNLRDEVAQPVRDAGSARLVEDGIVGNERFVGMDKIEREAGQGIDRDGQLGHVGRVGPQIVLPEGHQGLDVGVRELVDCRQGDKAHDRRVGVEDAVDVGSPLFLVGDGHGRSARTLQVELQVVGCAGIWNIATDSIAFGECVGWLI